MKTLKRNLIEKEYSSQEIENFITGQKVQNRVKKDRMDWRIFKKFCFWRSKRDSFDMTNVSESDLDRLLCHLPFFCERMIEATSSQT